MGNLIHDYVKPEHLSGTLKTGTISLPLTDARELSGGAFINAAGNGGILASDTTPTLTFNNGGVRATWAATNVDAICWSIMPPVDMDGTKPAVVHVLASMSDTNDTPVLGVAVVEGMSNTDIGGNTTAVSGTTPTDKTVTIDAADFTGDNQWTVTITPAAHGTDALRIDSVWLTYTRS